MANWTVDQVSKWLKANGFEKYTKTFKDEDIDGVALMGLRDDDISQLLSVFDKNGTRKNPTSRTKHRFRAKLDQWRVKLRQAQEKRDSHRETNDASIDNRGTLENADDNKKATKQISSILSKSTDLTINNAESYSKAYFIEPTNSNVKFFKNPFFCLGLQKYLSENYHVQCHIPLPDEEDDEIGVQIQFSGVKIDVKNARSYIRSLFETLKTKIFNNENTDERVIYWSKHIYSDSAINVIQRIFDIKNLFTVWNKTDLLSGYYVVHYFGKRGMFGVSEENINQTINSEISYAKDIIVPNLENMQTNFRNELDQFLDDKKQQQEQSQTLSIIYCKYSFQTEMKISFFGQKDLVKNAKKQLQSLINKHRMKTVYIELDSIQRDYLLDNCVRQLKDIELKYKDDHVKILIHENLFRAPQYLTSKIKPMINGLVFQTTTITVRFLENVSTPTANDNSQLEQIARKYDCQIDGIDVQTKTEIVTLPKSMTTSTLISTSKSLIQQSNQFYSTLSMLKEVSISNSTIEIYKSNDSMVPTAQVNIISTARDAIKEHIEPNCGNIYFETDNGRKILYLQWIPSSSQADNDRANILFKRSIKKFISTSLEQIANLSTDYVQTIAFSTTEWENYANGKQLVEEIMNELKYQLETNKFSNYRWRFLFIFDDKQIDLYDLFSQTILAIQTTSHNDYEQFYYPISTLTIILKTSRDHNLLKCRNAINDHLKKDLFALIEIDNAFDSEIWNQHMINAYYKYCLEKCVLPEIEQTDTQRTQQRRLCLTGSRSTVNEVKRKYELMTKITEQKMVAPTQIPEPIDQPMPNKKRRLRKKKIVDSASDAYNITISCCSDDKILSHRLADRLTDEGYSVSVNCFDQVSQIVGSSFDKTDLILICFSRSYAENRNFKTELEFAKKSVKKIVTIAMTNSLSHQDNSWLYSVTTADLYYELFKEEIQFLLDGNLDLEYDKLLIELLHYTKPGVFGRTYSVPQTVPNIEQEQEQEKKRDPPNNSPPQLTEEQIRQRQQIYEQTVDKIKSQHTISTDEMGKLILSLQLVIEDFPCAVEEQERREESNPDTQYDEEREEFGELVNGDEEEVIQEYEHDDRDENGSENLSNIDWRRRTNYLENNANVQDYLNTFLSCLRCWLKKASTESMIKGNLPPFTLTGDFNDAQFPMPLTNKDPWWITSENIEDLDHSPLEIYPTLTIGSWCNHHEADLYFQKLIDLDIKFREDRHKLRRKQEEQAQYGTIVPKTVQHPNFTTEIKEGHIAWDLMEDRRDVAEYEKRKKRKQTKLQKRYSIGWKRVMERMVQLRSDLKEGKIDFKSDIVQGKIGNESKTKEEMQKRNKLDDPNNELWTSKRRFRCVPEFIQAKIQNTIGWQKFCEKSASTTELAQ